MLVLTFIVSFFWYPAEICTKCSDFNGHLCNAHTIAFALPLFLLAFRNTYLGSVMHSKGVPRTIPSELRQVFD